MSESVLDRLIDSLRKAAIYNRHDLAAPAVVLWTDGERLWSKVIPLLRDAMPELLTLAPEIADDRTGPSTWLRYRLARCDWQQTPVVYLPGVARHAFRGAAGFPESARHLFALQYQGQFWSQLNGKDWTPSAFLSSKEGGLGLDLARDRATLGAVSDQLAQVLRANLDSLKGRRLEAADFHGLAAGDPIGLLLEWIASGDGRHDQWPAERWTAFKALAKGTFSLDPDKDGVITAVERLVAGGGVWDQVWKRYREAPKAFAGVRQALDLVQPKDLFDLGNDRIPVTNRKDEDSLRSGLKGLAVLQRAEALKKLAQLCEQHARRADTPWAELGEAPLARAAVYLQTLAEGIAAGLAGNDWAGLAAAYLERGWLVDSSAWRAYAAVRDAPDVDAVKAAPRAVYLPWLEELAERVQGWATTYPMAGPAQAQRFELASGTVLVFVDGLRCDLGLILQGLLRELDLTVDLATRWSALPTVTATAKPAWLPLADSLIGNRLPEGFEPQIAESGRNLTTQGFRNLLAACGWRWLDPTAMGDPAGAAWTEAGTFDHDGHAQGARLAWRIEEELRAVALRVRDLLQAGWRQAVLLTDHGWLLLPGGLPKVDLPSHLAQSRWARCAVLQPGVQDVCQELPWFWGGGHGFASAPGVSTFIQGFEYAHGGLSLQEALTPVLTVTASQPPLGAVQIVSAEWKGLRLGVQLQGGYTGILLDLRTKPADPGSTLLGPGHVPKAPDADGKASLVVVDDSLAGSSALLVVLREGQVVAKQPVMIGPE